MPRKARALPLAFVSYHPDRLRHSQNRLEPGMCTLVASMLPKEAIPFFLAEAGFGRTEFIRWLQQKGFAFLIRLRADTLVHYRGRIQPLSHFDTFEGAPIILSNVRYREKNPVTVNISLIGFQVPKRWHDYFSSRPGLSIIWVALQTLELCLKPRHQKVWRRHIWPALWLQSG